MTHGASVQLADKILSGRGELDVGKRESVCVCVKREEETMAVGEWE